MEKVRQSAAELLEREFLDHRARLLDVAAFLDRLDRADGSRGVRSDFRYIALLEMLKMIGSGRLNRVEEMLVTLSDPGIEPTEDRIQSGKAIGAWRNPP